VFLLLLEPALLQLFRQAGVHILGDAVSGRNLGKIDSIEHALLECCWNVQLRLYLVQHGLQEAWECHLGDAGLLGIVDLEVQEDVPPLLI
jgi:hypothetical protein